jgi:hypothetical protein
MRSGDTFTTNSSAWNLFFQTWSARDSPFEVLNAGLLSFRHLPPFKIHDSRMMELARRQGGVQ